MKFGVTLRNMGPQSSLETLLSCARAADGCGLESLWITDHIAIPPDDAEGSGGRYLDPLITLSFIAGATDSIKLGTGVLILPYRAALPTAKQVATLQELSGERLLLGVGIGWMDAEFRALGIDRHQRGRISDEILEFLHRCFENDVVDANGQDFLFRPNPQRPPIYIGGRAPHALERAARLGDGWLPMGGEPDHLAIDIAEYHRLCAEAGKVAGGVSLMRALPLNDPIACAQLITDYEAIGVDRLVCAIGYDNPAEYRVELSKLTDLV